MGFEPVTFGTAARRSTAAVGGNLGDMGDRGFILPLMTYDLPYNKDLWARGIDPRLRGSVHSQTIDGNCRFEKYGRRRGFLCII